MKHIGLTPVHPLHARHLARPHKPPAGVKIPTRATLSARNRKQARGILAFTALAIVSIIIACIFPGSERGNGGAQ